MYIPAGTIIPDEREPYRFSEQAEGATRTTPELVVFVPNPAAEAVAPQPFAEPVHSQSPRESLLTEPETLGPDGVTPMLSTGSKLTALVPDGLTPMPSTGSKLSAATQHQRLHRMFNTFAAQAKAGLPCEFLTAKGGLPTAATYVLDRSMQVLTWNPAVQGTAEHMIKCRIGTIQDVFTYKEDGSQHFPVALLSNLSDAKKELLLLITFQDRHGRPKELYMIETSEQARDTFLECLRILNTSAQPTGA